MKIEKNKIQLFFDYVGIGLVAKGGELTHFEIAGEDRKFFPAKAKIDGKTIVVSSDQVKSPVAVRFAFQNMDKPNLFNKAGLPASSFRTDIWEIVTERVFISGKYDPASDGFVIAMKCELNPMEIRYTTDGSEPTMNSKRYSNKLRFKDSIQVKARAFQGKIPSVSVAESKFVRHLANGRKIKLIYPFSSRYPSGGDIAILNEMKGSDNFRDGNWQGFEGDDFEAIIDLGEPTPIHNISTGFLQAVNLWAFFPQIVEYAVSQDGQNYQTIATVTNDVPDNQPGSLIKEFAAKITCVSVRYVKVRAKNIGVCSDWHAGAGGKAWLFVDEVVVE